MLNKTAVAACAAALLGLAGPVHAEEVLKIGAVVTLSGAGAAWGRGMLYAA